MNHTRLNTRLLQRDEVEMMVMMVLVVEMMMTMMITMKSSSMTVTMAMVSPPPGKNFPGRFLSARELFSLWCFPPHSGGGICFWSLSQS